MSHDSIDELAAELEADGVLGALAETCTESPPAPLRSQLLGAIAGRARLPIDPMPAAEVYHRRVLSLAATLAELDPAEWELSVEPYVWSVRRLVAHVAMVEEYTLRQLGATERAPLPPDDASSAHHLAIGGDEFERLSGQPFEVIAGRWRAAADAVAEWVMSPAADLGAPSPLHGWRFDAATALVARAFELWTHTDDIRRATGRTLTAPEPAALRTMSALSVGSLPSLLALVEQRPLTPTRVVLTGPGGGTFDLGGGTGDNQPSLAGAAPNLLVADVVDYCRVVSRRLDPADLAGERQGDLALLGALLHASQAIAI